MTEIMPVPRKIVNYCFTSRGLCLRLCICLELVILNPLVDLGLSQTLDVFAGEGRGFAAAGVNKVQAAFGLEQDLFITGRIAIGAVGALLDQGSGLGVVLLLANDLLHVA